VVTEAAEDFTEVEVEGDFMEAEEDFTEGEERTEVA
jgi:hypothetical protein